LVIFLTWELNIEMKKKIKINFSDFWGEEFDKGNNFFIKLLSQKYDVILSERPDILIYSCYGFNFLEYNCLRVFFTGENTRPDFFECDYALSFDYPEYGAKNYRLPLYKLYEDIEMLLRPKSVDEIASSKSKFCNMLVSNSYGKERVQFFEKLSKYKKVDSGGRYLNNIGYRVEDRLKFVKDYKFTLAFENTSFLFVSLPVPSKI